MTSARCDTMASRTAPHGRARRQVVRVRSDRRLSRLTVLCLADWGAPVHRTSPAKGSAATAASQPSVISRAAGSADESLRFDAVSRLQSRVTTPLIYRGGGCPPVGAG